VNGLAVDPTNKLVAYAASEWGGLYKTTDGGHQWSRLDGHRPVVTWDVAVNPTNPNRVYATSFYDGRNPAQSQSGINVSTDGGVTWTHPATAVPPPGLCANAADQTELSAFGIAIDKLNSSKIYIGTSCGLAISTNAGDTWSFSAPLGAGTGARIWDVVSAEADTVDTCGDNGHRWYNQFGTWQTGSGLPSGMCSIAASPYSPPINLFATVGTRIYETANGTTWSETRTNAVPAGRVPFVATNKRSEANKFDLWFGDVLLYRATCDANAAGFKCGTRTLNCCLNGGTCTNTSCRAAVCGTAGYGSCCTTWTSDCSDLAQRVCGCDTPAWSPTLVDWGNGHGDQGDIVFDPTVSADACPLLNSADAGIVYNSSLTSPACQTPTWNEPAKSPHGLWPMGMSGVVDHASGDEQVLFGNQDNGVFGTLDAKAVTPSWRSDSCCDVFDALAAPATATNDETVVYSLCCGSPRATSYFRSYTDFSSRYVLNPPPAGLPPGWRYPDAIARWGDKKYAMLTNDCTVGSGDCHSADGGLFITQDIEAGTVAWTELGNNASEFPSNTACAVYTSNDDPTFYVQAGDCNGEVAGDKVYRFFGTGAGNWTQLSMPGGRDVGIFAVDPTNPSRLIASAVTATQANMYMSVDAGGTWSALPALDVLMRGNGDFPIQNQRGPTDFMGLNGYLQPSFAAFDPVESSTIIAGGQDSGIFLSKDNGVSWSLLTDPRNSHVSGIPHIPRPRHAYFSESNHNKAIYVSSQGRGVWRFGVCNTDAYEGPAGDDDRPHANPILPGEIQSHSICATGDTDWSVFNLTEASAVTITTAGASGDTVLHLRDSLGNVIAQDDNGSGSGLFSRIQRGCGGGVLTAGTYSIEVGENGANDTIASYTLSLEITPCCGNGSIDAAEECDDGNRQNGDCCSSACVPAPSQAPCDDSDACTVNDACNGLGVCTGSRAAVPTQLAMVSMTSSLMSWPPQPSAASYDVVSGDLGVLHQSGGSFAAATTSCLADDLAVTQADHSALVPGPGGALFFLVRAVNCSGPGSYDEGYSQVAPRDGGIEASPGRCGTSCVAGRCLPGSPFSGVCGVDPCISEICVSYPGCCTTSWDAACVDAVRSVCGSLTCRASAPACAHPACTQGSALLSGCDDPPVSPSCVASICSADSYCCTTAWDGQCVAEVVSVCGFNCQ
jgi:cysteine-rich repeat protein